MPAPPPDRRTHGVAERIRSSLLAPADEGANLVLRVSGGGHVIAKPQGHLPERPLSPPTSKRRIQIMSPQLRGHPLAIIVEAAHWIPPSGQMASVTPRAPGRAVTG